MDTASLLALLGGLPVGPLRYFETLGSTNDEAARWAQAGAPDLSLVVADEQTAGRGRLGRRWYTPASAALAFSLVLRPDSSISGPGLTALGALSVCTALKAKYGLNAQVKWPNDVLVGRQKLAGVLAESTWIGERLETVVLGIGINVSPSSVPPEAQVSFPATCIEEVLGSPVDRWSLLRAILAALLDWRNRLGSQEFWQAWEGALAFRGEQVFLQVEGGEPLSGLLLGIDKEGSLRLRFPGGGVRTIQFGEVRLRPVDSDPK